MKNTKSSQRPHLTLRIDPENLPGQDKSEVAERQILRSEIETGEDLLWQRICKQLEPPQN